MSAMRGRLRAMGRRAGAAKWTAAYHLKTLAGGLLFRRERHGSLDIDLSDRVGMGALLGFALRLHALAEEWGVPARIACTSPLYSDGADVFARYFRRPAIAKDWRPHSRLATTWLIQKAAPRNLSIPHAHRLLSEHFPPGDELDAILAGKAFDLAVHFRGTDKFRESGDVAMSAMWTRLDARLPAHGAGQHVFLATDDHAFAAAVRRRYPAASFETFELGEVEPGTPRHFSRLSPGDKALEALANIYLLASAKACVRTASYLSALAKIANPELMTETINSTPSMHSFPEQAVADAEEAGR